ncbi:hypothetical protein [Phnomibacter sp. MR]|uniref:hypothetical protein n=1 Tax=Phnomibacter sp. MR TaxID=3042318 RepID=UPI003A811090
MYQLLFPCCHKHPSSWAAGLAVVAGRCGGIVWGGHYYQRPELLLHKALYVDSPKASCCIAALAGIGF